jgi:hypothetical protein
VAVPLSDRSPYSRWRGRSVARSRLWISGSSAIECCLGRGEVRCRITRTITNRNTSAVTRVGTADLRRFMVPNPITSSDRGCTLSVKRLMPHFELAFFTGSGYEHDAKTTFQTDSYGEKHVVETTADHEGNVRFAILPFVSGHQHGKTSIKAASLGCSPALTFDWGQ